jgi:hypothetical protein
MAEALARGDRKEFFRILSATRLHLPSVPGTGEFVTRRLMDRTHLVAYTSPAALTAAFDGWITTWRSTDYSRLRATWPSPTWRLAINPGLPLDAYAEVWAVDGAAAGRTGTLLMSLEVP